MADVLAQGARAESAARGRFSRAHFWVLLGLYALAMTLLRDAVSGARLQNAEHPHALASAIAAPFFGPFLGSYATAGENAPAPHPCEVLTPSLVVLALCLAFQFAPLRWSRGRLFFWAVGWTVWFGASLASLMQVLS